MGAMGVSIGLSVLILVIITSVLLGVSFKSIPQDSMGLKHNKLSNVVYKQTLFQGKYHVWPGQDLFIFKRRFVTLDYNIGNSTDNCLTKDGLYNSISINLQYQIDKDFLYDVLFTWGTGEKLERYIRASAWDSIRAVCGRYSAEDFFLARGEIQTAMLNQTSEDLAQSDAHVSIGSVQISNIDLPDDFVAAINKKQLAIQESERVTNERQGKLTEAETLLKVAEQDALISVIQAKGKASGIILAAEQDAATIRTQGQKIASAFGIIRANLGISAEEFVNGYLTTEILKSGEGATINIA